VAAKGRIEVQCPRCGNIQLEAEFAKSTYCRKCSGYIRLEKGGRPAESLEPARPPSVLRKLEGFLGVQRTVVARCFECTGKREVPKSATSSICPQCGAYIDLQDYKIIGNFSRSVRTRGRLFVTAKGDVISSRIICESAEIQGSMRGSLICSGEVKIKLHGRLIGSVEAKRVLIDRRAEVEFVRPVRAELVEVDGSISARIISNGRVVIRKTGRLTGAVFARGFIVEKGGEFFGELSIGRVEMTQGELLDTGSSSGRFVPEARPWNGLQPGTGVRGEDL
jgi:cytoskeletal protein CcmA (bactofilin family)/ribosomal protein S27AE